MNRQQIYILLNKVIKNLETYQINNKGVKAYIKSQATILSIILNELLKEKDE